MTRPHSLFAVLQAPLAIELPLFCERDRAPAGPAQERRRDEALDDRGARVALEAPQPHRLRRRQAQPRHFPELSANPVDDILKIHWQSSFGW